jgi:hypothetical protein
MRSDFSAIRADRREKMERQFFSSGLAAGSAIDGPGIAWAAVICRDWASNHHERHAEFAGNLQFSQVVRERTC